MGRFTSSVLSRYAKKNKHKLHKKSEIQKTLHSRYGRRRMSVYSARKSVYSAYKRLKYLKYRNIEHYNVLAKPASYVLIGAVSFHSVDAHADTQQTSLSTEIENTQQQVVYTNIQKEKAVDSISKSHEEAQQIDKTIKSVKDEITRQDNSHLSKNGAPLAQSSAKNTDDSSKTIERVVQVTHTDKSDVVQEAPVKEALVQKTPEQKNVELETSEQKISKQQTKTTKAAIQEIVQAQQDNTKASSENEILASDEENTADNILIIDDVTIDTSLLDEQVVASESMPKQHLPKNQRYDDIIVELARNANIDPGFVKAIIHAESNFDRYARSYVGARGLMQLMPATARSFGVTDAYDPYNNLEGGLRYLKYLSKKYKGNKTLILAGYNAGEGNVRKYKGVPPFRETRNYIKKVMGYYNRKYKKMDSLYP